MLRPAWFALATLATLSAIAPAGAQMLPPRGIPGGDGYSQSQAQSSDSANLLLRIDRLENQLRSITGQLEQSQFQVRRLEEQLRKFQTDVEARFQDGGRGAAPRPTAAPQPTTPQRRGSLEADGVVVTADQQPADPTPAASPTPGRRSRGDAFDPASDPGAPGAPRQLGTLTADPAAPAGRTSGLYAGPLDSENDPNAPLDLLRGSTPRTPASVPPQQPQVIAGTPPVGRPPQADPGASVASIAPPASPRDEFDLANASLKDGHYEVAETAFRTFLQKHPKDRLAADATFYLGESYYRRSRPREAAEQYLKVSTDFARSARAPEALVKLGLSLEKLGAREQACAAYGEVGRKYPNASTALRASAERESKRAQC